MCKARELLCARQACATRGPMYLWLDHTASSIFALVLSLPGPEGHGRKAVVSRQISQLGKFSSRKPSLSFPALESAPCSNFSDKAPLTLYQLPWLTVNSPHACNSQVSREWKRLDVFPSIALHAAFPPSIIQHVCTKFCGKNE